jgi:hypothetical protein
MMWTRFTWLRIGEILGSLFSGVKRPDREADHSYPPSTELKNAWSYTSTSPSAYLIKGIRLYSVVLS